MGLLQLIVIQSVQIENLMSQPPPQPVKEYVYIEKPPEIVKQIEYVQVQAKP
jgi:hypothetical protein